MSKKLKNLTLRRIPKGDIIFEIDSLGKEFFIVFEGECGVYSKTKFVSDLKEKQIKKMIEKKDLIVLESEVSRMKSDFQGVPLTTKTRKRTKVEYREKMGFIVYFRGRAMKRVARISKGMAFGGMSLSEKNKNGRRTATILAEEDTYCLVLDRDSYLVKTKKNIKINFFF